MYLYLLIIHRFTIYWLMVSIEYIYTEDSIFEKEVNMKKHFATVVTATLMLGATTAFAANPFSDVTPDTWAYQSVSQLANTGIINGYPDGTFKGQHQITRYEMAQMVAKAIAHQDRANVEQQALINRLADEFSAELNNLGIHVSNLENRVGNVKVTGDARLRYHQVQYGSSSFDYRGRIQFNGAINDTTSATVRVGTSNTFGVAQIVDANNNPTSNLHTVVDRLYVSHKFSNTVNGVVGRQGLMIGNGLMYDNQFDGALFTYGTPTISAAVGYGTPIKSSMVQFPPLASSTVKDSATVTVAQVKGVIAEGISLGAFYVRGNKDINTVTYKNETNVVTNGNADSTEPGVHFARIYGVNADVHVGKAWIGGEWLQASWDQSSAWVAGIGYGNFNQSKPGTWTVKTQYMYAQENAPILSSTWKFKNTQKETYEREHGDFKNALKNTQILRTGFKGWLATLRYTVAKNVAFNMYYGFGNSTVHSKAVIDQTTTKLNDKKLDSYYQAELNFKF